MPLTYPGLKEDPLFFPKPGDQPGPNPEVWGFHEVLLEAGSGVSWGGPQSMAWAECEKGSQLSRSSEDRSGLSSSCRLFAM